MPTLTLEQFLAYVARCVPAHGDMVRYKVYSISKGVRDPAGFDYNTIKPDPYFEWFCIVMETVVEKIDYLKQ